MAVKKSLIAVLTVGIVAIALIFGYTHYKNPNNKGVKDMKIMDKTSKTNVYGVLNVSMEKNNMIWCGTFQLAWNELRDNIIKEDIKLVGEDKLSSELNKKSFDKGYVNEKDYIAMAGYNKDGIVEKINKTLKEKFNEGGSWKVQSKLQRPDDILAYSFLKKNLEFNYAFKDMKNGLNFDGTKVKAFGISNEVENESIREKLAEQVKILYYNNDNDFIISLDGKTSNDEIILANIPARDTLGSTLNYATDLISSNKKASFSNRDVLKVPVIEFSINKEFKELENKAVANKGFKNYTLASAIQRADFSLTKKGTELKSKAEIIMKETSAIQKSKKLIFDKPFLLYMKEKGNKKPYFVMWVDNAEIMMK